MSRNQAFDEGVGRSDPLSIAIEGARREHAKHFGIDINTAKIVNNTELNSPYNLSFPVNPGKEFNPTGATHMTAVQHPDPQTGLWRRTAWHIHVNGSEQSPTPAKFNKSMPWCYDWPVNPEEMNQ